MARLSNLKEYRAWGDMKKRCLNPKSKDYPRYGGRGIGICARWDSFERFLADVGRAPSKSHSLDRINNDGDYEPGNVRWATKREQANNRENTRILELNGRRQLLADWARELGMSARTLEYRHWLGWSDERALTTPIDHSRNWRLRRSYPMQPASVT